jgi:hypothetical protein
MDKEFFIRLAQYTALDDAAHSNQRSYYHDYYGNTEPQKILPFLDPALKKEISRSHWEVEEKRKEDENNQKKKQPLNFGLPPMKQEDIRYKNFDEPNGQGSLEGVAKDTVLKRYNQLRSVAAKFYVEYKEANELANSVVSLDYNKTYYELMKAMPEFLINEIKKHIGELFGIVRGRRFYEQDSRSRRIARFMEKGINIFNINNRQMSEPGGVMEQMSQTIYDMQSIMDENNKRKKLLIKLPAMLSSAAADFLKSKYNRDMLKYFDEYFAGYKQEFMEESLAGVYDKDASYYRKRYGNRNETFKIGDLKKIRTFKAIYEKAQDRITHNVFNQVKHKSWKKVEETIKEEIINRIQPQVNKLIEIVGNGQPDDANDAINKLTKFAYRTLRIDLSSILNFARTATKQYNMQHSINATEGAPDQEELLKEDAIIAEREANKYAYIFLRDLGDAMRDLVVINVGIKDYETDKITGTRKEIPYQLQSIIDGETAKMMKKYVITPKSRAKSVSSNDSREFIDTKAISQVSEKDLNEVAIKILRDVVVNALPNFRGSGSYSKNYPEFPSFISVGNLIKDAGKFSIDAFTNSIHSKIPFVPKDFVLNLVRSLFKNVDKISSENMGKSFNKLNDIGNEQSTITLKILLDLLQRSGKLNPDSFTNAFTQHFAIMQDTFYKLNSELPKLELQQNPDTAIQIIRNSIRNLNTIEQDSKNLTEFVSFAHNDAANLNKKDLLLLFQNKNFSQFSKIGIVRKLVKAYAQIRSLGNISGIKKEYGTVITALKKGDYISKNFEENIKLIVGFFQSSELINPKSELFDQLFKATSTFETDIEIIKMSETFKELLKDYEVKDKRLFNLDFAVNDRLRFRVLKDRDPRTLRVGVETNCCQRIGGVGESSAKDSFVNPLAGVVILEWKNNEGEWALLTQSYFHYVPDDNGYILDNVEDNEKAVETSGVNIEAAYAYWAASKSKELKLKYFLAGSGYSDIDDDKFGAGHLDEDPRFFSPKATRGSYYRNTPYTDFRASHNINLLEPKEDTLKATEQYSEQQEVKEAFERNLRRIILGYAA